MNVFIAIPANAVRLLICFVTLMSCCHSASGQDTISDIRGTHPKPWLKITHRVQPTSHSAKPHRAVALRHSLLPLKHRIASHNTQKSRVGLSQNEIADASTSSQPHLIGWWRADNNVLKSLDNSGSVHGKVSYVSGVFGQAFQFDGTDGINLGDPDILKLTKSFSISAWVNVSGLPEVSQNWGQIVYRGDRCPGLDPYQLAVSPSGSYNFQITNAFSNYAGVQAPVQMNKWAFLVGVLDDKKNSITLYVNGKMASRVSTTIRPLRDLDLKFNPGVSIGDDGEFSNSPSYECFRGAIADVRIYTGVLGESQIASDYEQGRSYLAATNGGKINTADPVASELHWSTVDGGRYLEITKNGLHLKPRTDSTGPHTVTATSLLAIPDTKNWQVSFEARFGGLRDQASSFHLLRDGKDIGWIGADGFYKGMGVFIGKDNDVTSSTADTAWHQVSYKSDGSTLTVNLDGKQVGTGPAQIVPNRLSLENSQDMTVPCHQEGVWVQNVSIKSEGQGLASGLSKPLFLEDFSDPAKSAQNWDQTTNGGTLLFSKGSVVLKGVGGGYPVIETKQNPFPLTGDWTAVFRYRYTSIGNYGTELTCGREQGEFLARVHQDVNGQLIQVDGKNLLITSPNTNPYAVAFVKNGEMLTVYLDGLKIGSDQAGANPSFISIGGGTETNPWDWNDLEVDFVGVERRL